MRLLILSILGLVYIISTNANNAIYINLSNSAAKKKQLSAISNNLANIDTIGYESDNLLVSKHRIPGSKSKNDYIAVIGTYKDLPSQQIQQTGQPLDIAVLGGYLKILTPKGFRYTLNGQMLVDKNSTLVNFLGYPFLDSSNSPILLPNSRSNTTISKDGWIFVDNQAIAQIGVFVFQSRHKLIKEGQNLYYSPIPDRLAEDFSIQSGALNLSNVDINSLLEESIKISHSMRATNHTGSNIAKLERSMIKKLVD